MKMKRIAALFLAALMIIPVFCVSARAAEEVAIENYHSTAYTDQQKKVDTMEMMYKSDEYGYEMYFDRKSGEFALKNLKTGEYVFSNPYDVAVNAKTNETHRQALMSQVILSYTDVETQSTGIFNSFKDAAMNGDQITFKTLTNGVRVEYALGTVESKRLIPYWIEKSRFEEKIYNILDAQRSNMTKDELNTFNSFFINGERDSQANIYRLLDQTDPDNAVYVSIWRDADTGYKCLAANHDMVIYVLNQQSARVVKKVEALIRKYCPEYTYDELEYDHELTMYEGDAKEPALFRLAIEYTIDEHGLSASIPSKSIRYNETNYMLESISLLPYFGCASTKSTGNITRTGGYLFIPDGSGTIIEYYNDDGTVKTKGSQGGKIYGPDYVSGELASADVNENIAKYRLPVFGLTQYYNETITTERSGRAAKVDVVAHKSGWLGVITEGESFASLTAYIGNVYGASGGGNCEYNTVTASFTVKQVDATASAAASSGSTASGGSGGSAALSGTVDTKYLGNYTIRYILLTDPVAAEKNNVKDYYYPSYVGMAAAYRNYLIKTGGMEKIKDLENDTTMPLYINTFGYTTAYEKFLSFPISKKKALTSYEDIQKMCNILGESNINDVRILMTETGNVITKVKWPGVLGGKKGFEKLLRYAEENGATIYPDYDFASVSYLDANAGFSFKKYAAKSMIGKYKMVRDYDYVWQMVLAGGARNVVSTGSFEAIYEKFAKKYLKYNVGAIGVSSLGSMLSSDFDEDDPITREDSKYYTTEFLKKLKADNGKVLVSGGNAFTLPYVTDIVDFSLDNSGFSVSTASVPFAGMVLHGYANYAGTPMNLEGDVQYRLLKSIENGAALYFTLSYQNTELLKGSMLSDYYAVSFDLWLPQVVSLYKTLNDAIGTLQNATITTHETEKALSLDESSAAILFGTYNRLTADCKKARAEYEAAVAEVDRLVADQKDYSAATAVEVAKLAAYNNAKSALDFCEAVMKRNYEKNVVSVTYESDNGKTKTFFINYNSFDVVVEGEKGVFTIPAKNFVEKSDVKETELPISSVEAVTAYKPTAIGLKTFEAALESYESAIASGNAIQIARAKETLQNTVSSMPKQGNVLKVVGADGKIMYINTTADRVIAETGTLEYAVIAKHSFAYAGN